MAQQSWATKFLDSNHGFMLAGELQKNQTGDSLVDYEGILLDTMTNEAVSSETGLSLDVKDMEDSQVFVELQARDIPTTGTAKQRASRLQARPRYTTMVDKESREDMLLSQCTPASSGGLQHAEGSDACPELAMNGMIKVLVEENPEQGRLQEVLGCWYNVRH